MQYIDSFSFSLTSLLVVNLLPFLYFGYHSKFWYDYRRLKTFDFFLSAVAIVLGSVVVVKTVRIHQALEISDYKLILLHLVPIALTFLIVQRSKHQVSASPDTSSDPSDNKSKTFAPKPMNHEITKLGWDDLVVDVTLKQELLSVIALLQDPKTSGKYGISPPKGILLAGPPGTGKTTIAKVMANVAGLNFFNLSNDQIVSKWVGESEKNLTALFNAARRYAPSVIFIDEVDAIGRGRGSGGAHYSENLLNHLLQLMDGVVETKGVYVIAATNRADLVDEALKRPGRLNKVIEVPLPGYEAREQLFYLYLSKLHLSEEVDLSYLAHISEGTSAADIAAICNQAGLNAFKRESIEGQGKNRKYTVNNHDLELAFKDFATDGLHSSSTS